MKTLAPIEISTRYATQVETMADAWSAVMEFTDRLNGTKPSIEIKPYTCICDHEDEHPAEGYYVVVSGLTEEPMPDAADAAHASEGEQP